MTLEQLRIFVAVAEREHVTLGARDLNLTQSATSAAIATLEARHSTKLFDRVGRRITLTEAGRIFLEEARAVLARANAAEGVLADLAELKRGAIVIAASQTVGNYWLPRQIARFTTAFPAISVRLTIGNTEAAAALVRDGAADMAVVEGEIFDPSLCVDPLAEDELVLITHPAHPAARSRSLINLGALRWVVRERGSGTRAQGWLYLAVVVDLFARKVVGWSMKPSLSKELALDALLMAVWRRKPAGRVVVHSDQGSQYGSDDFKRFCQAHNLEPSMSRRANCWDNAVHADPCG